MSRESFTASESEGCLLKFLRSCLQLVELSKSKRLESAVVKLWMHLNLRSSDVIPIVWNLRLSVRKSAALFTDAYSKDISADDIVRWFLRRNFWRKSTTAEKTLDSKRVIELLSLVNGLRNNCANPEAICNAVEVFIWMDIISDETIENIALKSVPVTCGNSRPKLTFLLAAFGNKLCKNGKRVQCDLLNFADQSAEICMWTTCRLDHPNYYFAMDWKRMGLKNSIVWDTFQCHKPIKRN